MQETGFKALKFDESARAQLVDGVNILANAVKVTMGPKGQNVIIERPGMIPHLTKDGVTVARSINLRDKFQNLGVQMVKEAASRTAEVAGDGTTTATVLAQAMFSEGIKMLAAGYSSAELQKGMEYGLQGLVLNRMKGTLNVCAIRAPEFGELRIAAMRDLGVRLGCDPVITVDPAALQKIELDDLGKCKKVLSYKHRTVFVGAGGAEEEREHALAEVKSLLDDIILDEVEKAALNRRVQRLAGGVAVLRVGAATEVELHERKDRVEDALHATQAASEEGVVAGGGMALVRASSGLKKVRRSVKESEDFKVGIDVICKACCAPLKQIVENSGGSSEIIVQKALKTSYNYGYNAATEEWVDMFNAGIIDPLKVVRTAIENASSVARMLLSVGCAVIEDESANGDTLNESGLVFSS
jgi:chaperonin GroEL (HSP60 family)